MDLLPYRQVPCPLDLSRPPLSLITSIFDFCTLQLLVTSSTVMVQASTHCRVLVSIMKWTLNFSEFENVCNNHSIQVLVLVHRHCTSTEQYSHIKLCVIYRNIK